jgi:hypothetical protein
VTRLAPPGGAAREPAWEGGFLSPPPHLPFGDPLTQPNAAGLAEPLRRLLRGPAAAAAARRPARRVRASRPATARAFAPSGGAALGGALFVLAAALAALAFARGG